MTIPVYDLVFYIFAGVLIASSLGVVLMRHPVRAILCLILAFFACSVLWMMLQAEFLSLVLIFVYVGAVMTLFLFVVMMMHIDTNHLSQAQFIRYLPWALLVLGIFIGGMVYAIHMSHLSGFTTLPAQTPGASNTQAMGELLFTKYAYPFEVAGAILLVAIVSAIALAFHGRKPYTQAQKIADQIAVTKSDRLRMIKSEDAK